MRIAIIGGGAVAEMLRARLTDAFAAAVGVELVQQWTRKTAGPLVEADLYIIAVSDRAIGEVSAALPFAAGAVVAHTSGGVSMAALDERIEHRAVIYPLQTFTRGRVPGEFPVLVEGSTPHALEVARRAADALSDDVREMSSDERARLHLAAVVANNFTNAMMSWSAELASGDFALLRPLVAETVAKAMALTPQEAQTGPARRDDKAVMAAHEAMLEPEQRELYKRVSELIWRISKND